MRPEPRRLLITGAGFALVLLILLFPPWRACAIRTTTRYAAVENVAPATLIDTVGWSIRFLPLFAPPRAPFTSGETRELARRARIGDTVAKRRLVREMDPFEQRVGAPEILRTRGELWRDSVLSAAGVPSVSFYDASFTLDDGAIALRLTLVVLLALVADRRRIAAGRSRGAGGGDHNPSQARMRRG